MNISLAKVESIAVTFSPSTVTPPCSTALRASDLEVARPALNTRDITSLAQSLKFSSESSANGIFSASPPENIDLAVSSVFLASSSP